MPATDSYIEKEATINDEIDRMRLSPPGPLFERRDVVIVASVSCIYGLGSPEAYYGLMLPLRAGATRRTRLDPAEAGGDSVRAERPRLRPRHLPGARRHRRGAPLLRERRGADRALRRRGRRARQSFDPVTGQTLRHHDKLAVYPKSHFVTPQGADPAGGRGDHGGARRAPRPQLESIGQGAGGAAVAPADDVRPRDDAARSAICHGIENYAGTCRAAPPASRLPPCSTTCRRTP